LVGRSNAGKSSLINALVNRKDLARSSSRPGSTQEINVYLVNRDLYLLDLPGYGFVQKTKVGRERFQKIVEWYLFRSGYPQHKVVLLVDTNVGLTNDDFEMFRSLEVEGKDLIIDEKQADTIRQIFKMKRYQRKGLREIARTLNEQGVATARGGEWHAGTIKYILANQLYKGNMIYSGIEAKRADLALL
jgi:GTP-binding protein